MAGEKVEALHPSEERLAAGQSRRRAREIVGREILGIREHRRHDPFNENRDVGRDEREEREKEKPIFET